MAVYQELINFNEVFKYLRRPPIIINDLPNDTKEAKAYITSIISSEFTQDMVSLLPSCSCGVTKGEFNAGVTCDVCKTEVISTVENEIEPLVWFRKPEGVISLINPMILMLLSRRFTRSGYNIIHWLCDTRYTTKVKQPAILHKLTELGIPRGFNNFIQNFDQIMGILFSLREFGYRTGKVSPLEIILSENRDKIFADYIPIPNKSLLIVERTNTGIYIDNTIVEGIDTIESLVSIDKDFYDQNPKVKENRTAKALFKLINFYDLFFKSTGVKEGHFRRHIFGTRTNFSFRCVATSLTGNHKYDEIEVPWCAGITVFRPHIVNKLLKRGYELNSIIGIIYSDINKYDPLLDEILQELINETPDKGIYVLLNRNPTLLSGSIIRVKITKFKTNPFDTTIGISILAVKSLNLDFDGDCLNISLSLDNNIAEQWYSLHPKFNIYEATNPYEISGNISIPKPVILTTSSWLNSQ